MTPNPAAAFKENAKPTPDSSQTAEVVLLHPVAPVPQEVATHSILAANNPVIVVTKESTHSYAGMMKYVTETFPNVPIIFEDKKDICGADINDMHCARHVMKGDFTDQRARAHFGVADVVIVFGENPEAIHARANGGQTVLSQKSVDGGVNVGDIALNHKQGAYKNAEKWRASNARQISPNRYPV